MKPAFEEDREAAAAYVEGLLQYKFRDRQLLEEALTHSSFTNGPGRSGGRCYNRLEFLGDSVIDLAFSTFFYQEFPNINEGQLTDLRKANASNERLARVAVRHDLYPRLRRYNCTKTLDPLVRDFIKSLQKEPEGNSDIMVDDDRIKATKVLADIVEAIVGAIFVDCRFDLKVPFKVIKLLCEPIIQNEVGELTEYKQKSNEQRGKKHWPKRIFKDILAVFVIICALAAIGHLSP